MAKKASYNPAAKDGDGDGFVQDGTEWERPEDVEPAETLTDVEPDLPEEPLASLETPVEAPIVIERPRTYLVKAGDSYASIAKAHKPAGMTGFEYAKDLLAANSGKALRPGVVIIL